MAPMSTSTVFIFLTLASVLSSTVLAEDAADCIPKNLSGSEGNITLTYKKADESATCYLFHMSSVNSSLFLSVLPDLSSSNVSGITVYNVNSTGSITVVSKRSFEASTVDPYMVVGFGRDANETEEVIRVEVRLSESLAVNATVSIATYNSEACKLNYPSVPSMIKNPDYEMGSSANMTFACQLAVTNIKDASSVTSFVFTQFMFSEPSFLRVNTTRSDQYTGSELPPDVIARHTLFLEMQISSQSSDQFTLSMTSSTKDCTKYVSVTSDGTNITSLGYPSAYDNNLFCKLMLVSADNKPLQLTVTKIDLAKDNDKVEVVDGGASRASGKTIATLSALDNYKDKDAVLVSSGPVVMVRFTTDDLGTASGFYLVASEIGEGGRFYVPSKIQFPAANTTVTGPVNLVMQAPDEHMVKLSLEKAITNDDATMKCYDGDSTSSPVIAQYSKQFDLYPVFSSNDKMLCVASGVGNSTLFIAADSVTDGQGKFSSSAIDSLSLILPVKEAGEADYQFNWIVQPEVNASVYDVIQLVISEVDFPDTDSEISMKVQTMNSVNLINITRDSVFPMKLRSVVTAGLRLLIDIKPTTTSVTAGGQKPSLLVTADYTVEKSQVDIAGPTSSSGSVMSPFYPEGSPLYTDSTWMFTVEANKSLQLSFSSVFSLPPSSQLNITQQGGGSSDVSYTGPMPAAPSDLVINNTKGNESITVTVHLVTGSRDSAKVEITYTFLDAGYSGLLGKVPQELVVKQQVENSYAATWILTTPKTNSDGQLQRINLAVTFNKSNTTVLALRDGANAFSPFIPSPKTPYEKFSVTTNSNQLFVSYRFAGGSNTTTSSSFALTAMIDVCKSSFQCKDQSNQEICFPSVWRCDGVYHCQDGKDEKGCDATKPPPTKKPDTGKEGTPAWVVVVSILGGVVIGVIVTAIIITVVMRRRGRGYDRLNELMTPVPT